jgi:predicted phosphate transport protein (TIGR00153 family)
MPVDKRDFLTLLKEIDGILDSAEDILVLLDMRETKVPKEIKKDFIAVLKKANSTVETLDKAMELLKILLEVSFGGKPREDIKKVIHKIHKLEHESDVIEKQISRALFNNKDLDPITILHLLKVIDRMGCIADHAENAADMIRAMIAK